MIFISKYIVPRGYVGITLYPFIFLKNKELKENEVLVNHEKIHLRQQRELFVIFFYLFYVVEWIIKLIQFRNGYLAYVNLSFEREAYQNESNLNYLKSRKLYRFFNYL
ncbi:Peptidase M56 domain-containing protein [Tenacibaculum sp. 190524A05c]